MASMTIAAIDPGTGALELLVSGARCANCVAKIEKTIGAFAGVADARLNLSTGKLTVKTSRTLDPDTIIDRLQLLGYEARKFDPQTVIEEDADEGRTLLTCLAVAGFGVAFVVGLTDALYYGAADIGPGTRSLLNWLAALVAAPAALFAARPFFRSAVRSLRARRANMDVPISLAIVFSLGLSFFESLKGGQKTYFDAAVMLPFLLLIGRYLDLMVRQKAKAAASSLVAMQAVSARRFRPDGKLETVAAREIIAGDVILLATGERSSVDGTLEEAAQADVSLVSGESVPVRIAPGEVLYAGSIVTGPPVVLRAIAKVDNSLLAEITRLVEAGQQTRNRYVRLADRAASLYVPLVHGLALAVLLVWLIPLHAGFTVAATTAVSMLIITCPCALGLAVPAVQVVATGLLFRQGLLVKSPDALERLAEVDVAVFDKTGTLTVGRPQLMQAEAVTDGSIERAAELARASRHPLAMALVEAAGSGPVATQAREVPGHGIEVLDEGGRRRLGDAKWVQEISPNARPAPAPGESLSSLWYGESTMPPVRFDFADKLRADTELSLRALKSKGISVEILSGDRSEPVATVAAQTGVTAWSARVDPLAKAAHLSRAGGHKTLMVGDGLNDAAALAMAHVSIAPASAIDAAQAHADMVLRGPSLWPIVQGVAVARSARRRVLENFAFAALYNAVAVPLAAFGLVTPVIAAVAMASSSLLVTLNAFRQSVPARP